jgi:hypothetical protein
MSTIIYTPARFLASQNLILQVRSSQGSRVVFGQPGISSSDLRTGPSATRVLSSTSIQDPIPSSVSSSSFKLFEKFILLLPIRTKSLVKITAQVSRKKETRIYPF